MATSISDNRIATSALIPSHPTYATWYPVWQRLAHVFEGSGGFLDGTYIIPHPREWEDHSTPIYATDDTQKIIGWQVNPNPTKPTAKLLERRRLARYENLAAKIIGTKLSALFRQEPVRTVANAKDGAHPWLDWCNNVDGAKTTMTAYMRESWRLAGVFSHSITLMDRPKTDSQPKTMAEMPLPILRLYAPLDMPDWLTNDLGQLTAVKLAEAVPRTTFSNPAIDVTSVRVREVNAESWTVTDISKKSGRKPVETSQGSGMHAMGCLPVVVLYGNRRALIPVIGQSILKDPQLYIDLYNLTSEIRELLRKQTFSLLNIPLGSGDQAIDIEVAKTQAGASTGTSNVLFSGHPAQFIQADTSNVTVYQAERKDLMRTIFREADVPWESDSKDAEAEGSLKLKREDLNVILSAYADECMLAEMQIAELFFRAHYGPESWEKEWQAAGPVIRYSKTFDPTPFEEMLDQASAAMALPLGRSKAFLVELCKRLVVQFLPDASDEIIAGIMAEIEKLPDPEQERLARISLLTNEFNGGDPMDGEMPTGMPKGGQMMESAA